MDRQRLEELRDRTGASIIGANTLREENPEMRASDGVLPPERLRAVITWSGSIPVAGKKLFQHGPRPVVFTKKEAASSLQERLKNKARIIVLPQGPGGLSLTAALDFFSAEGVESLLIEGGALEGTLGSVIGVGQARGIGVIFILCGFLMLLVTVAAYAYPRLRLVEDELPDVIPDGVPDLEPDAAGAIA